MVENKLQELYSKALNKYSGDSGHKKGQRRALRYFYYLMQDELGQKR